MAIGSINTREIGELKKLELQGFGKGSGKSPIDKPFIVQINPSSISYDYTIEYKQEESHNKSTENKELLKIPSQNISFDFILDATGAIPGKNIDITEEIELLKRNVYYFYGEEHDVPYVLIKWGGELIKYNNNTLYSRITSIKISHTLFSSSGKPLRAKVSLSFATSVDKKDEPKIGKPSSPDLTHHIKVKAGDNLPQMCMEIYGNSSYYTQIAEINNILNFRYLEPGTELKFPPLK